MCRSTLGIQSAATEIRRGKKRRKKKKKPHDQTIMSAPAAQGGHNNRMNEVHRRLSNCIFASAVYDFAKHWPIFKSFHR